MARKPANNDADNLQDLDDEGFPDDGTGGAEDIPEKDQEDTADEEEDEESAAPAEAAQPAQRRKGFLSRAPRKTRTPRARKSASATTKASLGDSGEVQVRIKPPSQPRQQPAEQEDNDEAYGRPSLLKLLGGRTQGRLTIKRTVTKGKKVLSSDTGVLPGIFSDTTDLPEIIRAKFGGGHYEVTGQLEGYKEPVTESLDIAGDSKPLVEEDSNPWADFFEDGGDVRQDSRRGFGYDLSDTDLSDQSWWIWDNRKGTYVWTKPNTSVPTCPQPNQGLPPGVTSVSQGNTTGTGDWYSAPPQVNNNNQALELEREARRKAEEEKRLFEIQARHEKEMAELRSMIAQAAQRKPDKDPMDSFVSFMTAQIQKEAEDRKQKAEDEQRRWEREQTIRREEENRRRDELKAEADKRAEEARIERERRETERKEERDRDDRRREEREKREEKFLEMTLSMSKGQSSASQLKDLLGIASGMRELLGVGERSEFDDTKSLILTGAQVFSDSLVPAFAEMISAWKHGRNPMPPQAEEIQAENLGPPPPPAPRIPTAATNGAPQVSTELTDRQYGELLDFAIKAHNSGNSPKVAAVAFAGFCMGRGIPVELAKAKISEVTADQLANMLGNYAAIMPNSHPLRASVVAARAVLSGPTGKEWFDAFSALVAGRQPPPTKTNDTTAPGA